jgi:hypothetical protein
MRTRLFALLVVAVLPLLSGCSFRRQWNAALKQPLPQNDISGPWEGHWVSDASGHTDALRCVITPAAGNTYDAFFKAKYRKVFSFSYTVPLQVRQTATDFAFSGEADLGKLAGGVYTYEGHATPATYESTYKSKYDHGRFEMTRPALAPPE